MLKRSIAAIFRKGFSMERIKVLLIGGLGYGLLEWCWRGYSHWTMMITGGICLLVLYEAAPRWQGDYLVFRCIKGAILITCIELMVGLLVNCTLHWQVWDYSTSPGNLLGQICPLYFLLWYFLCYPLFGLISFLRKMFQSRTLTAKEQPVIMKSKG